LFVAVVAVASLVAVAVSVATLALDEQFLALKFHLLQGASGDIGTRN
jgi:hypothetical protein